MSCKHQIVQVMRPLGGERLRCLECHLTISEADLDGDCCPECYERTGKQYTDFERVQDDAGGPTRYRCDECGEMLGQG